MQSQFGNSKPTLRRVPQKMLRLCVALCLAAALAIPVDPVMSYVDEERMNVGPQTNMAEQVRRLQRGRPLSHFMVPGLASESVPASEELMPAGQTIERLPSLITILRASASAFQPEVTLLEG